LDEWAKDQPEPLDVGLLLVEKVESDHILARIPCRLVDHESPHPFGMEVWLKINPLTQAVARIA
jgi:hypothetical protein